MNTIHFGIHYCHRCGLLRDEAYLKLEKLPNEHVEYVCIEPCEPRERPMEVEIGDYLEEDDRRGF